MTSEARRRFGGDRRWAAACGLPPETLSRLRKRESCDLRTLEALASAAGFRLVLSGACEARAGFGREEEERLLDLCASGATDAAVWRTYGEPFFMAGLAMMLAGARGFDRRRYLELAEEALKGYVGDVDAVRASIDLACNLVAAAQARGARKAKTT